MPTGLGTGGRSITLVLLPFPSHAIVVAAGSPVLHVSLVVAASSLPWFAGEQVVPHPTTAISVSWVVSALSAGLTSAAALRTLLRDALPCSNQLNELPQ